MSFWQGKRVLITGGAGFFGSVVVRKLRERGGAELFAPRSREYDLRQAHAIRKLLGDTRPDIVIHLAARVGGIARIARIPRSFSTTTS